MTVAFRPSLFPEPELKLRLRRRSDEPIVFALSRKLRGKWAWKVPGQPYHGPFNTREAAEVDCGLTGQRASD
jgi:hypothetical protein